jgi:hypothetical protein
VKIEDPMFAGDRRAQRYTEDETIELAPAFAMREAAAPAQWNLVASLVRAIEARRVQQVLR